MKTLLAAFVVACLVVTSCTSNAPDAPPEPPNDGLVAIDAWRARQLQYLQHATTRVDPGSLDDVLAATARQRVDPAYRFDARVMTTRRIAPVLGKIAENRDTSDFDLMRLWLLWRTAHDGLDPQTRATFEERILGYRYWYTDPLPAGKLDHKWFWSENHRIIAHTLEYLAGKHLPEARFQVTGEPGRVHAERGQARLLAWLDEKARWGFSEWHSDVYYAEDIQALLLLAEHGDDLISARAAAMLDVFLLDVGIHQFQGNMGSTHGRTYMKDKARAVDQNTRDLIHLLFGEDQPGDTESGGYSDRTDFAAVLFATATRYRLPEAIRRAANDPGPMTDREQMGVPIDPTEPFGLSTPPPGTSYTDPNALAFWWDRGAMTAWQVVPLSLQQIREHRLWTTALFSPLAPLMRRRDLDNPLAAQYAAYALGCQINQGLLTRANTVTHRTGEGMLSSVQDYRAGCFGRQYHAWQATLGPDAVVFSTHPGTTDGGKWDDEDLYWNGGTMPRVAQSHGALIAIYAPKYAAGKGDEVNFLPLTHAYFPTEHFDEVRQVGHWVFGRRGDGYVALWSHRAAQFAEPARNPAGLTKRYDLVAPGGADNVWITETGAKARWGSFDAFVQQHEAAPITVTPRPEASPGVPGGFDVQYASPAEGELRFGSAGAFTVANKEVDLHPDARMDNPYAHVAAGQTAWTIAIGDARWTLDLATGRRAP